jgi:peptide/nickel transport system permease protein
MMSPGLRRYIIVRALLTVPMAFVLVSLVFLVLRVIPGDPALAVLREGASEEQLASFRAALGMDRPLHVQYLDFIWNAMQGDLGESMTRKRPVTEEIKTFFPATVELTLSSMLVIAIVGVFSGAFAAQHRKSAADYSIRVMSIIFYSMPIFWLGLMLQILLGARLGWLPVSGRLDAGMAPAQVITWPGSSSASRGPTCWSCCSKTTSPPGGRAAWPNGCWSTSTVCATRSSLSSRCWGCNLRCCWPGPS